MLLLDRGEAEAACASLERSLIGQSWWTMQRQGMILAHLAIAYAIAGRVEKAQELIDDLAGQGSRWPMPSIRALTNEAAAVLASRHGDEQEALRRLHLARQLWTSIGSALNSTRLRLEIATLLSDAGDRSSSGTEIRAAAMSAELLARRNCCDGAVHYKKRTAFDWKASKTTLKRAFLTSLDCRTVYLPMLGLLSDRDVSCASLPASTTVRLPWHWLGNMASTRTTRTQMIC